jgi:hypothetical protein
MRTNIGFTIITQTIYCIQYGKIITQHTECYVPRCSNACECCMHQHTTAQCEPGDCLLLCCSHHCTQHRVCTAWWYFSRHSMYCASSAVRQIQCTNKTQGSDWNWSQEEHHFQCVLQCHQRVSLESSQSSMLAILIRSGIHTDVNGCVMRSQNQRGGEGSLTEVDQ